MIGHEMDFHVDRCWQNDCRFGFAHHPQIAIEFLRESRNALNDEFPSKARMDKPPVAPGKAAVSPRIGS